MLKAGTRDIAKRIIICIMVAVLAVAGVPAMPEKVSAADDFETSIAGFPESYKPYLRELHAKYPKWTFKPYNTGIDFSTAVANQATQSKSLLEKSYNDYLKSRAANDYNASTGAYIPKDGSTWIVASKNTIAYFMDPRNFLNESFITIFEQLSYDPSVHTQDGVEAILADSFMYKTNICYLTAAGKYKTTEVLYSTRIMDAAIASKVSPYYLASKILQEVGKGASTKYDGMGSGNSVNGLHSTYPGIYNFYNIGASDGSNAVANGLNWASSGTTYRRPWNKPGYSIIGGAEYIGSKYINCGQDTSYFQRFNVKKDTGYALYSHQYMTSIYGCASESASTANAYQNLGIMKNAKTFVIPVYLNMPNENTTVKVGSSTKTGVVNSNVNMRKGPNTSSDKVITLLKDSKVKILEGVMTDILYSVKWLNNPYWYKVQVTSEGKTYTGYVSANYINVDSEMDVIKGVSQKLNVSVSNSDMVYYETDDPAIATVDAEGNVTGKKAGTTTIRIYTQCGNFTMCTVKVVDKGAVLSEKSLKLKLKETKTLTATVYPTSSTDKTVTWSSSDKSVATVNSKGKITAKSVGKATIYAKAKVGGVVGECTVTVYKPVTGISLDKTKLTVITGTTKTLTATVTPSDATTKTVTWKSSDKKIAKVKKGVITGVSAGTVTITATTKDGGKVATCTVTVKPPKTSIKKVAANGYDSLKVSWNNVSGITGYKIYRKQGKGSYELITTVAADKASYVDKNLLTGTRYAYKVAAYKTTDGKDYNASKSGGVALVVIPKKPSAKAVTNKKKATATLSWKQINGADGYVVYRKIGKKGKYGVKKKITSGSTISYKDSNLQSGVIYYYRVKSYRLVNGKKIYSDSSKSVKVTG